MSVDHDRPGSPSARGQTLPDFVVGIAIFLVTVTLIVQFVPQIILPHEDQERPVAAQRITGQLRGDFLASGETPSELDAICTKAFFNQTDVAGCPIDASDPLPAQLGVDPTYSLNVTLRTAPSNDPDSAVLCEDFSAGVCSGNKLAVGAPVPQQNESVAIARRRVFVNDTGAVIEVGVW